MSQPSSMSLPPLRRGDLIHVDGKRRRLGSSGVQTLRLVGQIVQDLPDGDDPRWLLAHRDRVRRIERLDAAKALTLVIDCTEDERLRCLAIWLRGRCGGALGVATVARYATASDRRLRKETARCLKRLHAWPELRAIAEADPDPRIRRLATQSGARPYANRLAGYCQRVPRRVFRRPQRELFIAPELEVGHGRAPKSPSWIRMVLQRIQRLMSAATL